MTLPIHRHAHFDYIRILLTLLVVLHHTAITYGGSGDWYWRELPNFSSVPLIMLNTIDQSFFMGFFFLLSGYFLAGTLEHKNATQVLWDRFIRLGIPLVIFFFLLSPLTIALASPGDTPLLTKYWQMLQAGAFGAGPLWFAEALLIFSLAYLWLRRWGTHRFWKPAGLPGFWLLLAIALGLGWIAFMLRLVIPVGKDVLWLQLGFFPSYVFLFYAGCMAYGSQLLDKVSFRYALPWMLISVAAISTLPLALAGVFGQGAFTGGLNMNAAYYAFWEPLAACGIILGLLWGFRRYLCKATPFSTWVSRRLYGVYILHAPVLVAFSVACSKYELNPYLKFFMVGSITFALCLLLTSLLLFFPLLRKVL